MQLSQFPLPPLIRFQPQTPQIQLASTLPSKSPYCVHPPAHRFAPPKLPQPMLISLLLKPMPTPLSQTNLKLYIREDGNPAALDVCAQVTV